jgi:GMP synthase-like glutamine amidotransferase
MKKIYVLENISREGPGYLGQLMDQKQTLYEIIDLTQKQSFPALSQIKALIVMGGPDSANDQTLKITKEIAFIKEVLKAQIPYLGICLGLQIGVKAAGGTVRKNQVKEIGTRDQSGNLCQVSLSLEGLKDPLLLGLPHSIPVFHLHGETVTLTDSMKLLGTGPFCQNQIVKIQENAYGIQSHFELTSEMLKIWLAEDDDLKIADTKQIWSDFLKIQKTYIQTAKILFNNFLNLCKQ